MKPSNNKTAKELEAGVAVVRSVLDEIFNEQKKQTRDADALTRRRDEAAELRRTLSPDDSAGVAKLATIETEISLREQRIVSDLPAPLVGKLREALAALLPCVRAVAMPLREGIVAEVFKLVAPFYDQDGLAEDIGKASHAAQTVGRIVEARWLDIARFDPLGAAERALADGDKLLSGEKFWLRE